MKVFRKLHQLIKPIQFREGSLWEEKDRLEAARLVSQGEVVGVFNRGVNALWLDASNPKAVKELYRIKGEARIGRPVALTISFDQFISLINIDYLTPEVQEFLKLSENIREELGSLCFLRAPLKPSAVQDLPKSAIGFDEQKNGWLQTWDPHGHVLTEDLIEKVKKQGVKFPGVTSMNISGEPEIVLQDEAVLFCKNKKISLFLKDPYAHPETLGSYTILTLSQKGIEVTRDGNIPVKIIQPILNQKLILDGAKLSKYPQREFPLKMIEGLNAKGIRMAILLYLEGSHPQDINRHLSSITKFIDQ